MKTLARYACLSSLFLSIVILGPRDAFAVEETTASETITNATTTPDNGGLRLNFRGVPLDSVLDYLSKAAGFIIIREANVSGTVDVWSHQPLNKEEAVNLLNTILNQKGFAAIRNDRTLTIVTLEEAKRRDLPVIKGNQPDQIPRTDEMVTQIIPVKYVDAMQLINNLSPLIPEYASLTANESSNALILIDTQTNIHRITKIIQALDTSISNIATVKVFPLKHADATELATVITQVFEAPETNSRNNNSRQQMFQRMFGGRGNRGGGGPGGMGGPMGEMFGGGGGGGNDATGNSVAREVASRVVAVADQNTNSLVVSAPEELMPSIESLIKEIDTVSEDITEIRVFSLQYADAEEMADLITNLFEENSQSNQNSFSRVGRMFGGPGGMGMPGMPGGGGPGGQQQQNSERKVMEETVVAVADTRTNSVVVTAASETMNQIAQMIVEIDKDPAKKQKVFIYSLENADAEYVAEILRNMFELQTSGTSSNRRSTTTQTGRSSNSSSSGRNSGSSGSSGSSGLGGSSSGFSDR